MSVIERCPECGGPVGPSDLDAENDALRAALRGALAVDVENAERLRGAVRTLERIAHGIDWPYDNQTSYPPLSREAMAELASAYLATIGGQ